MVFVRDKEIKGEKYFYLVESYWKNGKSKQKNLKYLGKLMPNKIELNTLILEFTEKKIQQLIRKNIEYKPFKVNEDTLLKANLLQKKFYENIDKLSFKAKKQLIERFKTGYTYHSCSIEGNTLTRQQVDLVINKKESIGGKKLIELREVENHKNAIEYMISENSDLTEDFIKRLHKTLTNQITELKNDSKLEDFDPDFIEGDYRKDQRYIQGADFIPVIPDFIEGEMRELINFYKKNKYEIHPIELASEFHLRFVIIHPFTDGNGRIARLLMNFILDRSGFPMIDISVKNREEYINALGLGDSKNLSEFIVKEFENYLKEVFGK